MQMRGVGEGVAVESWSSDEHEMGKMVSVWERRP